MKQFTLAVAMVLLTASPAAAQDSFEQQVEKLLDELERGFQQFMREAEIFLDEVKEDLAQLKEELEAKARELEAELRPMIEEAVHEAEMWIRDLLGEEEAPRLQPKPRSRGVKALLAEARARAKAGALDTALERIEEAIKLDRRSPTAYLVRAELLLAAGRMERAVEDAARAIELDPALPAAHLLRADALSRLGDQAGAMAAANRALRLKPDSVDALQMRGTIRTRLAAQRTRRGQDAGEATRSAIKDFTRVLELNPRRADAHARRGECHLTLKQYDSALKDFERAVRFNPKYKTSLRKLIRKARDGKQGDY